MFSIGIIKHRIHIFYMFMIFEQIIQLIANTAHHITALDTSGPVNNNSIAQCRPSAGQSSGSTVCGSAGGAGLTTRRIMCGKNVNDGNEQLGVCAAQCG